MATPEENTAAIQVELRLMNATDSEAARDLANSLKEIAKMFDALKATNFTESATKLAAMHKQMVEDSKSLREQQAMTQRGGIVSRLASKFGGGEAASAAPEKAAAVEHRDKAADDLAEYQKSQREHLDSLDEESQKAQHQRTRLGLPHIGTEEGDDPDAWYNKVDSLSGNQSGFRIPRFGELNIQDLLARAQKWQNEAAAEGKPGAENRAVLLQKASTMAGTAYATKQFGRQALGYLASQGISASAMDAQGAALGYRRDTNPFSDILGIQTPFSDAGKQGARMALDMQKLRFSAGINKQQANEIVQATGNAGFSGQQGSAVANQFMAPLFRQFQIDPKLLADHLQVLRTGTATLGELSSELANIGEVARTAKVPVNLMSQALHQAEEASQAIGGSAMAGLNFGRAFTTSTGLVPNVGQKVLDNSTTQAMLSGATGLPSFALGAASTQAKMTASRQSMNLYYNAYKSALGTKGPKAAIKDAEGNVMGYEEGEDPTMAAVANKFGVSMDDAKKMMKGQDEQSRLVTLDTALNAYGQRADKLSSTKDVVAANKWIKGMGPNVRVNPHTGQIEKKGVAGGSGRGAGILRWQADDDLTKEYNKRSSKSNLSQMAEKAPGEIDEQDIIHAAHQAGIKGKALDKALSAKTVDEQIKNVRQLASEKTAKDSAKYEIAFTGPAAKFFKLLADKTGTKDEYNDLSGKVAAASTPAGSKGVNEASNVAATVASEATQSTRPGQNP